MVVEAQVQVHAGLEGIVVAQTRMSKVIGEEGRLIYAGYDIHDLAEHATFEEVTYMFWYCCLPNRRQLVSFEDSLRSRRNIPFHVMDLIRSAPTTQSHPMSVLRTAVSALALGDPGSNDISQASNLRRAADITAKIPTIVAAHDRNRKGLEVIGPREDLDHASNFLYMLHGRMPSEVESRALGLYLVLLADHEFNASTFSARVTASTQSDIFSAITSALGTLKGPAHGGAAEQTMLQILEIGHPDNVEAWYREARAQGKRIYGMGHRVYKTQDPRAIHLQRATAQLAELGDPRWYQIALKLEQVAREDPYMTERKIYCNVDFYSAPLLYYLGIDPDLFTCIFAMARVVGWIGHLLEQYADNRLIRPRSEYVGAENLRWVPLDER
ncbi:MAG: citrate/2-methylcitrate synthase [Anaerolineae bacterium]